MANLNQQPNDPLELLQLLANSIVSEIVKPSGSQAASEDILKLLGLLK